MSRAATARRVLLYLGLLVLLASLFTLSLEAKAWVDSTQHHVSKHYKVLETPVAVLAAPLKAGIEPLRIDWGHAPPATGDLAQRSEPCLTSHLLRAPPFRLA